MTSEISEVADAISRTAHDLNNLCASVLGYAVLAEDTIEASSPARPYLSEIRDAAERVAGLTEELRQLARRLRATPGGAPEGA